MKYVILCLYLACNKNEKNKMMVVCLIPFASHGVGLWTITSWAIGINTIVMVVLPIEGLSCSYTHMPRLDQNHRPVFYEMVVFVRKSQNILFCFVFFSDKSNLLISTKIFGFYFFIYFVFFIFYYSGKEAKCFNFSYSAKK